MDPSTQGAGAGITAAVLGVGAGAAELTRRAASRPCGVRRGPAGNPGGRPRFALML